MSLIKSTVLALLVILLGFALWGAYITYEFFTTPLSVPTQGITFQVAKGESISHIAFDLSQRQVLKYPKLLILLAKLRRVTNQVHSGEYAIRPGMRPDELLDSVINGKVLKRKITFIEGWTFAKMRQQLAAAPHLRATITQQADAQVMQRLGSTHLNPEGLFYPDTYFYTSGDDDLAVLRQAYQAMQRLLRRSWQHRDPLTPYKRPIEALIVASLIEHETSLDTERPLIAGVILNRLQQGMRLQIDPTVLYGVGKPYGAVITKQDLRDVNPYNTYRHSGLPPGPIGMPRAASLHAALHPAATKALFYVAQGGSQGHNFSKTYQQHQRYVAQYRQWYRDYQRHKVRTPQHTTALQLKTAVQSDQLCRPRLPLLITASCQLGPIAVADQLNQFIIELFNPVLYVKHWFEQQVWQMQQQIPQQESRHD